MKHLAQRLLPGLLAAAALGAQEWTDEQLQANTPGFQSDSLVSRLRQAGALAAARAQALPAMAARIHGDHREYMLKIERLLAELSDESWHVREAAERSLIEIGGRARSLIEQRREKFDVLEQSMRCTRILDALAAKGGEQEERELRLLRGLVLTSQYLEPSVSLQRALRSALGHTDASVVDGAIRALGRLGGQDEVAPIVQLLTQKGGAHRSVALAALGRMGAPGAVEACRALLADDATATADKIELLRALRTRGNDTAAVALVAEAGKSADPLVAAAARVQLPDEGPTTATVALPDPIEVETLILGIAGDSVRMRGGIEDLPEPELAFRDLDRIEFPKHASQAVTQARVFLSQGSLMVGDLVSVDATTVVVRSRLFGDVKVPRGDLQGIALDPALDRLVGGSPAVDRVRLRSGEFLDGELVDVDDKQVRIGQRAVARGDVGGLMFRRPLTTEPDATVYSRVDLVGGDRLLGFLAGGTGSHLGLAVPGLGVAAIPLAQVRKIEFGVGGGALWGFTLIADYSDNRVVEVDDQGRVVFSLEDIYAVWDAECLDNGNLLLTEYAVSRVREVNRKGEDVWVFESLNNPYDADRLPNGNTLIADTFGMRAIEVDKAGKIVWTYDKDVRPFDVERLPNGNTLIADMQHERVLEVSPQGEVVWEVGGMPQVHDADRLPNGNTLITLRSKGSVIEVDRDGKVVWELNGLSAPGDADRLPNGNTIVAENNRVREFDRRGTEVWRKEMMWAVEVNRY
ncbi:MAG: hypothetical protein RL398_3550 [Planctomycetota bacterium]